MIKKGVSGDVLVVVKLVLWGNNYFLFFILLIKVEWVDVDFRCLVLLSSFSVLLMLFFVMVFLIVLLK